MEKIGRYEITGELGRGAMGVVYKATDPNIGRTVALKTLRLDIHAEKHDEMLRRFQHEARAAGLLNHPNIVTIYDAGKAGGVFYIAMEYIEGRSLAAVLHQKKSLPATEIVEVGTQVCAGLQYAHFRKVVHRDIKPANIVIDTSGVVKITDFGIAKAAGANLTHTGEVLGTPNYMSPEQVKGEELDGRSDLFSTGIMLYEMLTGARPFEGDTVTTVIYKIMHETPVAPREVKSDIHPGLSMIVTKCLAKDPEDRYQEAVDLSTALRSYKIVSIPGANYSEHAPPPVAPPVGPQTVANTVANTVAATPPIPIFGASKLSTSAQAAAARTATVSPADTPTLVVAAPEKQRAQRTFGLFAIVAALLLASAAGIRWLRTRPAPVPAQQVQTTQTTPSPATAMEPPTPPAPGEVTPEQQIQSATEQLTAAANKFAPQSIQSAAPTGVGDLRITSTPPGATVQIDGVSQDWYVTPFNAPPMKAGQHSLVAALPGVAPQTRMVEVVPRKKVSVDFQLARDSVMFNIDSLPKGAEIEVDGAPTGSRTPAQLMLNPGEHRLALRLIGFEPMEMAMSGSAGQEVNIAPRLRARNSVEISNPQSPDAASLAESMKQMKERLARDLPQPPGYLIIRTVPQGVNIWVDDVTMMRGRRIPLMPGTHTLRVERNGKQLTKSFDIRAGETVHLAEILKER